MPGESTDEVPQSHEVRGGTDGKTISEMGEDGEPKRPTVIGIRQGFSGRSQRRMRNEMQQTSAGGGNGLQGLAKPTQPTHGAACRMGIAVHCLQRPENVEREVWQMQKKCKK